MALMPFPSLKMGPGQSSRSHTADEFVLLSEIEEGIGIYEKFIKQLAETL
jgi:acetylornithine deacetylase